MQFLTTLLPILATSLTSSLAAPAPVPVPVADVELEARGQSPLMFNRDSVADGTNIEYDSCDSSNTVTNVEISPCEGGNGTMEDPCVFTAGSNYTIILTYTSPEDSEAPRANLAAEDPESGKGYAYSGQSFGACSYTECPIQKNVTSTYTYNFVTLNSPFDKLTFNTTNGLAGNSLMCASFPIAFVPPADAEAAPESTKRSYLPRRPFGGMPARQPMA